MTIPLNWHDTIDLKRRHTLEQMALTGKDIVTINTETLEVKLYTPEEFAAEKVYQEMLGDKRILNFKTIDEVQAIVDKVMERQFPHLKDQEHIGE